VLTSKLKERSGNVYENKGPAYKARKRGRNAVGTDSVSAAATQSPLVRYDPVSKLNERSLNVYEKEDRPGKLESEAGMLSGPTASARQQRNLRWHAARGIQN
jgi:hypothetical protein